MRLIKIFGLAAVAAMAAMAFVGAGSASAADTALCNSHSALTCGFLLEADSVNVNNTNQGVVRLLSGLATVLCLTVEGSVGAFILSSPQLTTVSLWYIECGTNSAHDNCEIEMTGGADLPFAFLNKTGLDTGTLTGGSGEIFLECDNIDIFGTDIVCTYNFEGIQFSVGAQHLTAFETPVEEIGSDFLCPNEPTLDGLLRTTSNVYVLA